MKQICSWEPIATTPIARPASIPNFQFLLLQSFYIGNSAGVHDKQPSSTRMHESVDYTKLKVCSSMTMSCSVAIFNEL